MTWSRVTITLQVLQTDQFNSDNFSITESPDIISALFFKTIVLSHINRKLVPETA